ncbi:MAG: D-2-hydroxyacid dehydrogenase [Mobilitalea sp.]
MTKTLNILILTNTVFHLNENYLEQLLETVPQAALTVVEDNKVTIEMIRNAEIIFGWPELAQLQEAKNLRWIHLPSAGADGYTNREIYYNKEVLLTNSSGVFGLPIAEHVFAMILSYNRNLQDYAYYKSEKKWNRLPEARDFYGSTIGIIGLGDIGTEVAKRAKAWGAKVLGVKRTLTPTPEYVDQLYSLEDIDTVLEQSDYVVLSLPNTAKTVGIITEQRLRKMKHNSFLVNIGRGTLIDQDALIKALKEKWIGGAGLDVTVPEPLPEDSPLWELPNVIITPHTSGESPTNELRKFTIFNDNLKLYIENKALNNIVDFVEGY